jgi:hypothetical protein
MPVSVLEKNAESNSKIASIEKSSSSDNSFNECYSFVVVEVVYLEEKKGVVQLEKIACDRSWTFWSDLILESVRAPVYCRNSPA